MNIRDVPLLFEYPVLVPEYGIAYWSVPKNACTSLKYAFYKLRMGKDFVPLRIKNKYLYHIHTVLPSRPFKKLDHHPKSIKIAVVRNPVDRMVSAYCNRILHHNDLLKHQDELHRRGLVVQPSFTDFILNLAAYREVSKIIRDHTDPQVVYLGEDVTYFDLILNIKDLKHLPQTLSIPELALPRKQDNGSEYKQQVMAEIDQAVLTRIKQFNQKDYAVFGNFF